jgi:hypothetical protein
MKRFLAPVRALAVSLAIVVWLSGCTDMPNAPQSVLAPAEDLAVAATGSDLDWRAIGIATGPINPSDPNAPYWDPSCGPSPWECVSHSAYAPPSPTFPTSWVPVTSFTAALSWKATMKATGNTALYGQLRYGSTINMSSITYFTTPNAGGSIDVHFRALPTGTAVYGDVCRRYT